MSRPRYRIGAVILSLLAGLLVVFQSLLTNFVSTYLPIAWASHLGDAYAVLLATVLLTAILTWVGLWWLDHADADRKEFTAEQGQRNRHGMLTEVRAVWVSRFLKDSLYPGAHVTLHLHEEIVAATYQPDPSGEPQQPSLSIEQLYDEAGGELLILGAPGAGKTILLVELLRALLARAERDPLHQIPIMLNLASWATKQLKPRPFASWLVEALQSTYGVPAHITQPWIDNDELVLLLDGLDQVPKNHRETCVQAINAYRQNHGLARIVITCQTNEYRMLATNLERIRTATVEPLNHTQVDAFLSSAGGDLAAVRLALGRDRVLQELAVTPLMLDILARAYGGVPAETVPTIAIKRTRTQIFDQFIQRALSPQLKSIANSAEQSQHWLVQLARRMNERHQAVFYVESMKPDWLDAYQARSYFKLTTYIVWSVIGIAGGACAGVIAALQFGADAFPSLLICAIAGGFNVAWLHGITRDSSPGWWLLPVGLAMQIMVTQVVDPAALTGAPQNHLPSTVTLVAIVAAFVAWSIFAQVLLSRGEWNKDTYLVNPKAGISWFARQGARRALRFGLLLGLTYGLIIAYFRGLAEGLLIGTIVGLLCALAAGVIGGWQACIQHYVLRWLLWRAGMLPFRYHEFLDYLVSRSLLVRVGTAYSFRHGLLQLHCAKIGTISEPESLAAPPTWIPQV